MEDMLHFSLCSLQDMSFAEPKNTRRWIEDIRRWDQENPLEMRRDKGMTPQMIMEAVNEAFDSCVITTDVGQHRALCNRCRHFLHIHLKSSVSSDANNRFVILANHPYYIGNSGMHGRYAANIAVSECDVLFSIGTRFNDRITGDLNEFNAAPCQDQRTFG